jgi:hypothetical protein
MGNWNHKKKDKIIAKTDEELKKIQMYGIYWYTFPSLFKEAGEFPIKIGVSTNGKHPKHRVAQQCTSMPEKPIILGIHLHSEAKKLEKYLHKLFTELGKHKEDAGGSEWFIVSQMTIEKYILKFEHKHINTAFTFTLDTLLEPIKAKIIEDKKKQNEKQVKTLRKEELKDPYFDDWTETQKYLYVERGIISE